MNRTKATIAISIALSIVATTLILPILAPLIRELHLSVVQGGLMLSIGSVAMVVAAPLWGIVSDRYGRKKTIVAGFLGVFAGYAIYTLVVVGGLSGAMSVTAIFLALTASRAFVGAFLSAVPSGAQALMADITSPSERAGGMAIIGGATGLGLIVGPAVSGVLVAGGITWPLYAATALCASGALVALFFLKAPPAASPVRPQRTSLFSAALQPWLVAGILLWVAIATVQISAGFYFQDRLNLDGETAAGMLSVALTLVGIAMSSCSSCRSGSWGSRRVLSCFPERLAGSQGCFSSCRPRTHRHTISPTRCWGLEPDSSCQGSWPGHLWPSAMTIRGWRRASSPRRRASVSSSVRPPAPCFMNGTRPCPSGRSPG